MIAVNSSKGRRDEAEAVRYQNSPQQRRPALPGNHGIHRRPGTGATAPAESLPKLSGETGRLPLMEKQRVRGVVVTDRGGFPGVQRSSIPDRVNVSYPTNQLWDSRFNRHDPPAEWNYASQNAPRESSRMHQPLGSSHSSRSLASPPPSSSRSHTFPTSSSRHHAVASSALPSRPHGSSWMLYNGRPVPPQCLTALPSGRSWHWNRGSQPAGSELRYGHGQAHHSRPATFSWQASGQHASAAAAAAPRSPPPPVAAVFVNHDARGASKHRIESPTTIPAGKKPRSDLDKLDLLCQATLEIGPMHENPAGCTCPKSKCIALYCDCFKAGRRCNPKSCGCVDCKNTVAESGPDGARTRAIRSILARNPRAFVTAGMGNAPRTAAPGELFCNCIRSRCLKLYCTCFQAGKVCTDSCTCVGCYNTDADSTGERQLAIQLCLEKRPDAFETRVREPGLGCACKNNRCVRKYCECFRTGLSCSKRCSCRQCENRSSDNEDDDGEEKKFCP